MLKVLTTSNWLTLITAAAGLFAPAPAVFAGPEPTSHPASASLRVVTFNIRNSGAKDGPDAWPRRKTLFVDTVRRLDPDVLGLQEVLADQQDDMAAALPDYDTVTAGRDDGQRAGEASPVFYRRSRFDRLDGGTFWLSDTPDVVGSQGWDAALPRICTWAKLRDKTNGRELLAANTHFDHVGLAARKNAATLIVARLTHLAAGRPIVLVGDLNSTETMPAYATFLAGGGAAATNVAGDGGASGPTTADAHANGAKSADAKAAAWLDAYRVVHPKPSPDEATYHGFKGATRARRIDYVFCTDAFVPTAGEIDRKPGDGGRWPSDHYAVWCVLAWK